ncbi:hypothetical protein [Allonocardiopsis opalescens]|uniref:Uncharacterized protein n=1 Tax=Allonocardiopsis opalescens TaxID=1144618 RepID=A0A2T0Q7P2_9ACTN|nr:hypothetical protein [Allonocardiopsis opalescens]PRX99860.1 hypothetical protein CLV72_103467 [Allonocardiopsis opalescens]
MTNTPVPEKDLPAARFAQRKDHLMSEIERDARPGRRRLGRWAVGAAGALVLAGGGAAVATYVWDGGGAPVATQLSCHTSGEGPGSGNDISWMWQTTDQDPVDFCREQWLAGAIRTELDGDGMLHGEPRDPGRLVACIDEGGWVGVYPLAAGECADIGLEPVREATETERAEAVAVRALAQELHETAQPVDECIPLADLGARMEEALDRHGLDHWTVAPPPGGAVDCGMAVPNDARDRIELFRYVPDTPEYRERYPEEFDEARPADGDDSADEEEPTGEPEGDTVVNLDGGAPE